jgi:multidrug resistance efflux pump
MNAEVTQLPPVSEMPPAPAAPADEKPRDPVRTLTKGALITLLVLFVYHVVSDRITPYTSQSNIEVLLVQIAPRITGPVIEVGAHDNQHVTRGQVLYRIDPEPFEIAVRAAEANLALVQQKISVSTAEVRSTQATLNKQRTELAVNQELGGIVFGLTQEKALSESDAIKARAEIARARADVARGEAELESARQKLGAPGDDNPQIRQARSMLDQARLDLANTTVTAPADGFITNLRLSVGQYVNRGQPVMSFIEGNSVWLSAYLRENQLGKVAPGNAVRVAFDLLPGRVFDGRVESVGWGVTRGGEAPAGTLPDVQSAKGWLRDPQRFPVRIALKAEASTALGNLPLRNGAQANVLILTSEDSWLLNPVGRAWLRVVSWMSYFY